MSAQEEVQTEAETLLESQKVSRSKWTAPAVGAVLAFAVVGFFSAGFAAGKGASASTSKEFLGLSAVSACASPEPVDCQLGAADQKSLVFIASTALETPQAQATFDEMAAKLPKKEGTKGLKALLIEDAQIMKGNFFDKSSKDHLNPRAVNFEKVESSGGMNFNQADVQAWTDGFQNMDSSWGYDNAGIDGLGRIGMEAQDFSRVSIFGMCASKEQAKALYELQTKKIQPTVPMTVDASNPCLKKFETLLDQSNVVFANGGNPDIYGFVVKKFAPQLGELIRKRVQEGTLLYMGRSAGGMVGGSDFALTYEPSPALTSSLLNEDTRGLALAGKCALRPHIKNHLWDITSKIYAKATGQTVVLAANGEGLFCNQGCCGMTGTTEKTDPDSIKNAGYSASRIQKAYQAAYSGASEPTKFYDKAQAAEAKCGETSGKVVLTSNGLESAASQQAFVTLLKKDPSTVKVVSLDDGAYLSKGFWDATDAEFAKVGGVNYLTLQTPTAPSMVQEATQGFQGLVPGSGSTADTSLQTLGVSPTSISHISAFDRCASQEQKQALFALESQGVPPKVPMEADANCVSKLVGELASADVVVMGDGNADFLSFVYKKFAPSLGQALVDRVTSGNSVFLGLGGGSTFASASTMAAGSTGSKILKTLLQDNMEGLGLAGSCAVRPGFNPSVAWWDMTSALFEDATKMDFVGLEDGAALVCSGQCAVSGSETASKMMGADSGSLHRGRVHMILDNALD